MTASELIIDQPHLVRPGQKATALGVTLLFWGMLLYLWQPLISLVAWGFNIRLFHSHMIILGGYQALVDQLLPYALVIACLGTALLLWARLQQWRFSGEDRRRASPEVTPAAMAEHFGLDVESLQAARGQAVLRVRLADDGKVERVSKELTDELEPERNLLN